MLELRGIIQWWDEGKKHTRLVVRRDHGDIYEQHDLEADMAINKSKVLAELGKLQVKGAGPIVWPHHIEAKNIQVRENE